MIYPASVLSDLGNFQAVRIPADLAYERTDIELEIERIGAELRIRPARRDLTGVLAKFARFSPEFMADGREDGPSFFGGVMPAVISAILAVNASSPFAVASRSLKDST